MSIPGLAQIEEQYEVLEKLREGGMGAIYKVRHRLLQEERVVKVMRPHLEGDEETKRRFVQEAIAAVKLRHPNIAYIFDFSIDEDGTAFMVIEFIDGQNLKEILNQQGRLPTDVAVSYAQQALRALGYLHRRGFVHRDISPDNLMLTRDVDGSPLIKLIDLGIAKQLGGSLVGGAQTQKGTFLGKLRYASPEQFSGSDIDARSDLYSFGIVLYEMLTGVYPISGSDFSSLLAGHLNLPPKPFEECDPEGRIPATLRAAVMKALEKKPEHRFASAEGFSALLREVERKLDMAEEHTMIIRVPAEASAEASQTASLDGGQITALLGGARKLARLEQFDEAVAQIGVVLHTDPEHAEAVALEEMIEEQRRAAAALRAQLDEAQEGIAALLEEKKLDEAGRALGEAIGRCGEAEELRLLGNQLEALYQQQREETAARLLTEAHQLLAAGQLDEAQARLEQARSQSPATERAEKVAQELDVARRQLRQQELEGRAESLHRAIAASIDRGDLAAARKTLSTVSSEHRKLHDYDALAARMAELEEAQRHAARMAVIAEAITTQLSEGHLEMAAEALEAARRRYGDDPALTRVRQLLEQALARDRQQKEKQINAELSRLLTAARTEIAAADYDGADRRLREAQSLDPDSTEVPLLLEQAQKGRNLALALASAQHEIADLLDRGELEAAAQAIARVEQEHRSAADLGDARARLAELEGERKAQRKLAAKVQSLERVLERGDFERASSDLERAVAELGESNETKTLRRRIDDAFTSALRKEKEARRKMERARRRQQIAAKVEQVRRSPLRWTLGGVAVTAVAVVAVVAFSREPVVPGIDSQEVQSLLAAHDFGRFYALVVGNDVYRNLRPLETAVHDATDLASLLETRFGFEVELLLDADRTDTMKGLYALVERSDPEDNVLVFYAGHGDVVVAPTGRSTGYWQGVEAEVDNDASWISTTDVTDALLQLTAKRVLVIADSCFSGSLLPASDGEVEGTEGAPARVVNLDNVADVLTRSSRQVLTSGSLQPVPDRVLGDSSLFTGTLLEMLETSTETSTILDASTVYRRVSERVIREAARLEFDQIPQFGALGADLGGLFFFVPVTAASEITER